ncbi:glycoside hydrolase family 5 protein [Alienimonas chondri]|uniref:Glycoside hydrolase family 5 domain-containing protein n=1 Tax=Alienimonas chondri TaxID=2681879 RepID=A0ABX1VFP3_9PLAN|nr:glycoside hydrolase family 5 protein [Alienimonas chondri]NNJ26920.1 hypothetical protein [Alienimonas chondri]
MIDSTSSVSARFVHLGPLSLAMSRFAPFRITAALLLPLLSGCAAEAAPPSPAEVPADTARAVAANQLLARTINLSNSLEAPTEGEWGYTITPEHLDAIQAAGFTAVRVPVKWTAHAQQTAPYTVDPAFFARIDEVLNQALERRLAVVLDLHHYDEIHDDPSNANFDRLVGIWRQIARRYQNRPAALVFEPLNEPSLQLTTKRWSEKFPEVLAAIRETNPTRAVLVGPGNWNQIQELKDLTLPPDPDLILTVHTYEPYEFTHQGATWSENPPPTGRVFPRPGEEAEIRAFLDDCEAYAKPRNRPVFVGEFGVIRHAHEASRARWARFMRTEYERRGWSWGYWGFAAEFPAYDKVQGRWIEPMRAALLDD